jgi:hypothetical protein
LCGDVLAVGSLGVSFEEHFRGSREVSGRSRRLASAHRSSWAWSSFRELELELEFEFEFESNTKYRDHDAAQNDAMDGFSLHSLSLLSYHDAETMMKWTIHLHPLSTRRYFFWIKSDFRFHLAWA